MKNCVLASKKASPKKLPLPLRIVRIWCYVFCICLLTISTQDRAIVQTKHLSVCISWQISKLQICMKNTAGLLACTNLRIVRLCRPNDQGNPYCFCGGTLITREHVLTAFHCVDKDDKCTKQDFSNGEEEVLCLFLLFCDHLRFQGTTLLYWIQTISREKGFMRINLWINQSRFLS